MTTTLSTEQGLWHQMMIKKNFFFKNGSHLAKQEASLSSTVQPQLNQTFSYRVRSPRTVNVHAKPATFSVPFHCFQRHYIGSLYCKFSPMADWEVGWSEFSPLTDWVVGGTDETSDSAGNGKTLPKTSRCHDIKWRGTGSLVNRYLTSNQRRQFVWGLWFTASCMRHLIMLEEFGKVKQSQQGWQKSKRHTSWRSENHTKLYSYIKLLHA